MLPVSFDECLQVVIMTICNMSLETQVPNVAGRDIEELLSALGAVRHDPSEGFRSQLRELSEYLEVPHVLDRIEE